jgi:hypothetical protein
MNKDELDAVAQEFSMSRFVKSSDLHEAMLSEIVRLRQSQVPPGFQLVPVVPTMEMIDAAGEELYGHSREKAIEWAKEDKFESYAQDGIEAYRVMLKAAPQPPVTLPSNP